MLPIFRTVSILCIAVSLRQVAAVYTNASFQDADLSRVAQWMRDIPIAMTLQETAFLLRKLDASRSYFEYGCGGSTLLACIAGPPSLIINSIDSSSEWVDKIAANDCVKNASRHGRLSIQMCDIGRIGSWGFPKNHSDASKDTWHTYSDSISRVKGAIDLVLVDGRFRPACVMQALLLQPRATVLVHDFFEHHHHAHYAVILDVADVIERAEHFASLRRKEGVRDEQLENMYQEYKTNPNRF